MIPQRKRPVAPKNTELEFDTTQEIDPALVDSILSKGEATLVPGDYDETAVMLDLPEEPAKPANRRR